ncbi:MAG TPA: hypothetical protein PL085_11495 [Agriterribacter sp.]|uniref:hypothetical protein n=1 Tax=Agriterribacter sp. TaxID=2821509 RepID=UPI002B665622|nr:hypothetical protein [Agriterribacter sp.]HRQ17693.1 hypothetical protein [Agriterribacter sp.]
MSDETVTASLQREVSEIKHDMKEVLSILSGNPKIKGDEGVTGRILKNENRIETIEDWKLKKADYVVEDHIDLKKRVKDLEDLNNKNTVANNWAKYLAAAFIGAIVSKLISSLIN